MTFISCGCKICKKNLGEHTNELANEGYSLNEIIENLNYNLHQQIHWCVHEGYSLNEIIENLKNQGLNVDKKLVLKHLNAYDITLKSDNNVKKSNGNIVNIDLKSFDFSKYDFDITQPISIISYLQKLHLKIHLNQAELLLKYQNDALSGYSEDIPSDALKNIAISWKILSEVSGISVYVNQQNAIKTVESMGLIVSGQENILEGDNDNV